VLQKRVSRHLEQQLPHYEATYKNVNDFKTIPSYKLQGYKLMNENVTGLKNILKPEPLKWEI
jgi:hypothetical protein